MKKISISEKKRQQNYRKTLNMCGNCRYYRSHKSEITDGFWGEIRTIENKKRCAIGKFAVQKTATCDLWEEKK